MSIKWSKQIINVRILVHTYKFVRDIRKTYNHTNNTDIRTIYKLIHFCILYINIRWQHKRNDVNIWICGTCNVMMVYIVSKGVCVVVVFCAFAFELLSRFFLIRKSKQTKLKWVIKCTNTLALSSRKSSHHLTRKCSKSLTCYTIDDRKS